MFIKFATSKFLDIYKYNDFKKTSGSILDRLERKSDISVQSKKNILAKIEPNYLYVKLCMMHGDEANENGDLFPWSELLKKKAEGEYKDKYTFETWVGKPQLLNHDPKKIIGEILDCFPNKEDKSLEILTRISEKKVPYICKAIRNGSINSSSMGCSVAKSTCSHCKHVAETEDEWCDHLNPKELNLKGRRYLGQDGNRFPHLIGEKVVEIASGVVALEDSILSDAPPADPKALLKMILASQNSDYNMQSQPVDKRVIVLSAQKFKKS